MVVEILYGVASVDGDGVDDFVRVWLHGEGDIGVGQGEMRILCSCQSRKGQGCEQGKKDEEGMSFHQVLQVLYVVLQYFKCFFDKNLNGSIGQLLE